MRGSITVAAPQHRIRVAAIGDSITSGSDDKPADSYPAQLGGMLGEQYEVRNFGVSGSAVLKQGENVYLTTTQYTQSLEFQPDAVLIQLGTNDGRKYKTPGLSEFVSEYREIVRSYRGMASRPVVFVMLPPPVTKDGAFGITNAGVDAVNTAILEAMDTDEFADVTIVDNNSLFQNAPELLNDGVHPGAEGARRLAAHVRQALTGR